MSVALSAKAFLASPQIRLASGGWILFVGENFVLSENRNYLRANLGDENYHVLYGTFSTVAMGSIGYGYYKLRNLPSGTMRVAPLNLLTSWAFLSVGLILASQALPKMQVPLAVSRSPDGVKVQVCCPFDFSDQKNAVDAHQLRGMERVSRHVGLWSLALIGAGNAAVQTHPAMMIWWCGPSLVAWLGGMHSDSRFRRGMGGTLDPWYDSQTSNVPFFAMLTGKQGSPSHTFSSLIKETKVLNAACAVGFASLFVISRGKVRK